jgi:hypothetical protein
VGGYDGTNMTATTELFEPGGSTWVAGETLQTGRSLSTITKLADGRILVAGGYGAGMVAAVATAEILDPASGPWRPVAMSTPRWYHDATLLDNDMVLLAGGIGQSGELLDDAELFDPAADTFLPTTALGVARSQHTLTTLSDGRVLAAGGWNLEVPLASAEIYDPTQADWHRTGRLATARVAHSTVLLSDETALVVGGSATDGNAAPVPGGELFRSDGCGTSKLCEVAEVRELAYASYAELTRRFEAECYRQDRSRERGAEALAHAISGLDELFRALLELELSDGLLDGLMDSTQVIRAFWAWLDDLEGLRLPIISYEHCRLVKSLPSKLQAVGALVARERQAWRDGDTREALQIVRQQKSDISAYHPYLVQACGRAGTEAGPLALTQCIRALAPNSDTVQRLGAGLQNFLEAEMSYDPCVDARERPVACRR